MDNLYKLLLQIHSLTRYFVLIALVIVILMALLGIVNKKPFGKWDNKFSLYLLIFTHLQALAGLILYFVSPFVKFGSETMKDKFIRYWTVEHLTAMLIAVVLITVARISSKKMSSDLAKHKRLFNFNLIALIIIIATIYLGGRGIL
jgi:heme A synthase